MKSNEQLVRDLARDLEPVKLLPRLRALWAAALGLWALGIVGSMWLGGTAWPSHHAWEMPSYGGIFVALGAVGIGGLLGLASAVPGRERLARFGTAVCLLGSLIALGIGASVGWGHPRHLSAATDGACLARSVLLSLLPVGVLLGFLARGVAPNLGLSSWLGVSAALGLGALAALAMCPWAEGLHLFAAHSAGPLLAALLLAAPAALWLRQRSA